MGKYLTVEQAAERLGVSKRTAYEYAQKGIIPSVRLTPRTMRIPSDLLDDWLAAKAMERVATEAKTVATVTAQRRATAPDSAPRRGKVIRIA